eukprot:14936561-Alexandrium_andersonii.AAC.1
MEQCPFAIAGALAAHGALTGHGSARTRWGRGRSSMPTRKDCKGEALRASKGPSGESKFGPIRARLIRGAVGSQSWPVPARGSLRLRRLLPASSGRATLLVPPALPWSAGRCLPGCPRLPGERCRP